MMTKGGSAVFLLLAAKTAVAECVFDYSPQSPDEVAIVALEKEWCEAAIQRNAKRLADLFAEDVSWITDVGYRNRDQVLHRYLEEVQEHVMQQRDIRIRVLGDIALVQSHIHVKKTVDGKLVEDDHTDLDVLAKRGGRWVVIAE